MILIIAITMAGSQSQLTFGEVEAFRISSLIFAVAGLKQGDGIALCLENHPYFLPSAGVRFVRASISRPSVIDFSLRKSSTSLMIQAPKY